jgi:acyl-phosphate glycerol 3-phosphate acyltransferase
MSALAALLTLLAAYLLGAVPFGFLVARARGVNIFEHGSGNIGATNVGRIFGRPSGVLVFALDFAKGALPVALAYVIKPRFDEDYWSRGHVEVAAGMAAFLGHLFPVYLRFRGGKGVAAGLGAVSFLLPTPTLAALFVWLVLLAATRYMSLASIAAVVVLCAAHFRQPASWDLAEPRSWFCAIAGLLVVFKHRSNLKRFILGTENQLRDTFLMRQLNRSLHTLALGLWFGMTVFFTFVVALSLLDSFQSLGKREERETWFPFSPMYAEVSDEIDGPKEQGTRAGDGVAVLEAVGLVAPLARQPAVGRHRLRPGRLAGRTQGPRAARAAQPDDRGFSAHEVRPEAFARRRGCPASIS